MLNFRGFVTLLAPSLLLLCSCGGNINEDLIDAAGKGDDAAVKELLAQGADANAASEEEGQEGQLAFILAAGHGHDAVVQSLIGGGADIEIRDSEQRTPLMAAAASGHAGTVQVLLAAGAEVEAQDNRKRTAVLWAAARGHGEVIGALAEKGPTWTWRIRAVEPL